MSLLETTRSYSPLFLDLLRCRGFEREEDIRSFLHGDLTLLEDPFRMHGMREALERIQSALRRKEKVLVHGDYDVDGVTGAAIVTRLLRQLGIETSVFLPSREEDGYGVSARAIDAARAKGVSLLITVDCGISAAAEIALAKDNGLDVIVIDHHRIPEKGLPPADIILNPLQSGCDYPCRELSAAGLAFKLACALLGEEAFALLDLAAVSTVCDMAPLVAENRIIVKAGLKRLSLRTQPGLKALAQVGKIGNVPIQVGHIGFILGPRLNAAGRMGTPDMALQLLLTDHEQEAESLAAALHEENKLRQKEERQITKEALEEAERTVNFNRDRVIVVAKRGWHQGVIGIAASRLVEKYCRPAVVIAVGENGMGKGSARSIKAFNLYEALSACREHFREFGGHAQAAGLSIDEGEIEKFRRRVNEFARSATDADTFVRKTETDLEITLGDLSQPFVQELALLEPHGVGNPRPIFLTRALTVKTNPVRLTPQSLQFYVTDGFLAYEAVCGERSLAGSHFIPEEILRPGVKIDLAYSVKVKTWQGNARLVLEIKEIRPLA